MSRIGLLGGGQLGQMLIWSGVPLGHDFCVYNDKDDCPASLTGSMVTKGSFSDEMAILAWAQKFNPDVITYEFENIPVSSVKFLEQRGYKVFPPSQALEVSQDRLAEKNFFKNLGITIPKIHEVNSLDDLKCGIQYVGLPCVLKTRRFGYDGKGQAVIRSESQLEKAFSDCGGKDLILEEFIPFDFEISIVAVRGSDGKTDSYPLSLNRHHDGILRLSFSPAPAIQSEVVQKARAAADKVLTKLDYVGVLAIEFFVKEGQLIVNEMAPRVHNSGHQTIDGSQTSQFENHVRAITGLPLGSCESRGFSVMFNLIGDMPPKPALLRQFPEGVLHLYGKTPAKGRKLGHINFVTQSESEWEIILKKLGRLDPALPDTLFIKPV